MTNKSLQESMDLSGKVAIVTGGAMGIGFAICDRLSEAGASVLVADRDAAAAEAAAVKLASAGRKVIACAVDVSDESQVEAMIAKAVAEMGGVDILVNNAGIYPTETVLEGSKDHFEKVLRVNLLGAFYTARAAGKQMVSQSRGGKIINITSIDALHPSSVGLAFYDASKHGLWGFTKNLAIELAPHKIWVNAIAPGGVLTPGTGLGQPSNPTLAKVIDSFMNKIPMHRMADADEIGKVAVFLASDLSSYMTGSQVVVDGGTLLS